LGDESSRFPVSSANPRPVPPSPWAHDNGVHRIEGVLARIWRGPRQDLKRQGLNKFQSILINKTLVWTQCFSSKIWLLTWLYMFYSN
jgi:hypothetical protein